MPYAFLLWSLEKTLSSLSIRVERAGQWDGPPYYIGFLYKKLSVGVTHI